MVGGKYFSLNPPSLRLPSGMMSSSITMTIGTANTSGRCMTYTTVRPQKPFSSSSRDLVRLNRLILNASTWRPSTPRHAGSTVTAKIAASSTEAIPA
ncbi:Uncharacterised protein [Mycobacteroides abscessus subsp. abscessus]|nr:Uncharacterised protein [Mycobacteroides abscessus subsp. abscessus]SKT15303.1 Uncharacterised protein [Mycobacteroides abscessus subsp. abscessus]